MLGCTWSTLHGILLFALDSLTLNLSYTETSTEVEELEQVFDHFPRYYMKILLGDFNAKVGRENIFKPTIGK
jgi:hypothetical protein